MPKTFGGIPNVIEEEKQNGLVMKRQSRTFNGNEEKKK